MISRKILKIYFIWGYYTNYKESNEPKNNQIDFLSATCFGWFHVERPKSEKEEEEEEEEEEEATVVSVSRSLFNGTNTVSVAGEQQHTQQLCNYLFYAFIYRLCINVGPPPLTHS